MTRHKAMAEVERRRVSDPKVTWLATQRDGVWTVARIGLTPSKPTGTAVKPPPVVPQADPHSPLERTIWIAGTGG